MNYRELYEKSYNIRKRFIEIFSKRGYGHLTTAFSETEIMITLFERVMKYDDKKPVDRFVLSKGHGAGMVFPILEDMGFLRREDTDSIVCDGGDITAVREYALPGFEFFGGSLGIGMGMAAGMALGYKLSRDNRMVFCLVGDAECYEGSIWEAMLFAAHNRLNNLVVIVDRNNLGCSDFTENMCRLEPFAEKWKSCNWETKVINGHSYEELIPALDDCRSRRSVYPRVIIAETVKGKGLESISNIPLKHGFMPKDDELPRILDELKNWGGREFQTQ